MVDAVGHEQGDPHTLLLGLAGEELSGVGYGICGVRSLADVDGVHQSAQEHVKVLPVTEVLVDMDWAAVVDERHTGSQMPVRHLHLCHPLAEGAHKRFLLIEQKALRTLWAVQDECDL